MDMINSQQVEQFQKNGFINVAGLFSREDAVRFRQHYMDIWAENDYPQAPSQGDLRSNDPLKRYPRMMQMHRWDSLSLKWMLDERLCRWMTALLGNEPFAVQTMMYFKPPGSRGQALHQDQYYLRVEPGTCLAAWMALERIDEENGCLQVVPGTHDLPILCTKDADTSESFTDVTVPLPDGYTPVPVCMDPGDVLFFNGQIIHGSFPNVSQNRFRRSLIGHYVVGEAEKVSKWYHPVLRMDGSEVELGVSERGGPCGVWAEEDGVPTVKLAGHEVT